jgi:hypothetical protein
MRSRDEAAIGEALQKISRPDFPIHAGVLGTPEIKPGKRMNIIFQKQKGGYHVRKNINASSISCPVS